MKIFNATDWYWIVAGDPSRIFSSATGDFVQPDAPAYLAWKADGTQPSPIASEEEIGEVLSRYSIRPTRAAVLDAYKDIQARELTIKAMAKVVFNLHNRVLALEGKPPVNANQFRQALKDLM
jgi:hypothetical protein